MDMTVKLEMSASRYLVGQMVQARVTLENMSSAAIIVADPLLNELNPEYIVERPDGSRSTVSLGTARPKGAITDPMSPPVNATIELPPRGKWSEDVPLDPMLLLTIPGKHSLRVVLEMNGQRIQSDKVDFEMEVPSISAFGVVATAPRSRDARLFTAWAYSSLDSRGIVEAVRMGGMWGDDRRGKLYDFAVAPNGKGAITQVAVPEMFVERGMDFASWIVWTDSRGIWAQRTNAGKSEGDVVEVSSVADLLIVDPPRMDDAHNLSVFAVEKKGLASDLLRIDVERGLGGTGKLAFRGPLRCVPVALRALHFRSNGKNRSITVCLGREGDRTILLAGDGSSPEFRVVADFDTDVPIAGDPLFAETDGSTMRVLCALMGSPADGKVHIASVALDDLEKESPIVKREEVRVEVLRWGSLLSLNNEWHLLWGNNNDELWYTTRGFTQPSRVNSQFESARPPRLLTNGRDVFIMGARTHAGFGIEQVTVKAMQSRN